MGGSGPAYKAPSADIENSSDLRYKLTVLNNFPDKAESCSLL